MSLHALEIPDDPAQLPHWLEAHLTGLDLAKLVAELSAVHASPREATPSIEELLGDRLGKVLVGGLGTLPNETIRQLLLHPRLLLNLQELVYVRGGPYWDRVSTLGTELNDALARGRKRIKSFLPAGTQRFGVVAPDEPPVDPAKQHVMIVWPPVPWYRQAWVASLATAAAVLFGVFLYQRLQSPAATPVVTASTAWGWNRPDALPNEAAPDAYLNALADAAEEWFKKRPDDAAALAKRIAEFRQGCSALLLADHRPLAGEDRQWLLERCRAWATKLDGHLASIESGEDLLTVRGEADETVHKLVEALRNRAKGLATG